MKIIINKIKLSLIEKGVIATLLRIIKWPLKRITIFMFKRNLFKLDSAEARFTAIYSNNFWGDAESASGLGSTLRYTENLRSKLPELFEKYNIKNIFDAPCGDFNWMKLVLKQENIKYVGGDIVKSVIDSNTTQYGNQNIKFTHLDLTKDSYPFADLMICRDCLFHLSYSDCQKVLNRYLESQIPFLLTTSHLNENNFINRDILTGDFRCIDLFSEPFNFPLDSLEQIDDWLPPHQPRKMYLWSREQLIKAFDRPQQFN